MQYYRKDLKQKARSNRKNMNCAEAKIWYELLSKRQMLGYRFLRQKPIDNYIVDFYCHKLKLIIEIDGMSHNDQMAYDIGRTKTLQKNGFKVIRYTNWDVMSNLEGIAEDIKLTVKKREKELKPL